MPHAALGLGDLVLVVGEDQIDAAGVDVEPLAKVLHGHGRALDVPSGEPLAPRAVPSHQPVGPCLLPQGEVLGVAFVRVDLELLAMARPELVERVARELSVFGERADVVVDGPVDLVRVAVLDQTFRELDHLGDVLGGLGVDVDRQDVDGGFILQPGIGVELSDLRRALALRLGGQLHAVLALVEGVVAHVPDVGDVLDGTNLVAQVLQGPPQDVREEEAAQVADVGVAVDGRAAGVDADQSRGVRLEWLDRARQRAVEADGPGRCRRSVSHRRLRGAR